SVTPVPGDAPAGSRTGRPTPPGQARPGSVRRDQVRRDPARWDPVRWEQAWLDRAVAEATRNVAAGGGPFGALVVRGEEVLAVGTNQVTRTLDPTAHAEVVAIRAACAVVGDFTLAGCVLVSSCEPCPLCLSAALWARLDRIVYAADRDDAAE